MSKVDKVCVLYEVVEEYQLLLLPVLNLCINRGLIAYAFVEISVVSALHTESLTRRHNVGCTGAETKVEQLQCVVGLKIHFLLAGLCEAEQTWPCQLLPVLQATTATSQHTTTNVYINIVNLHVRHPLAIGIQ